MLGSMDDLGAPSSYLALRPGTAVFASDGEKIGKVEHVLAVPDDDVFDGIVLDTSVLPGGHRFVDAPEVDEIYERGAVLKIDAAAAGKLPEPSKNAGALEARPDDAVGPSHDKLRRAWDLISGNY